MKTILTFTLGCILTLITLSYLAPQQTHQARPTRTIHVNTIDTIETVRTIDLDRIRNTTAIDPDLDIRLAYECILYIARNTGENLAGITLYIAKNWNDDACAAAEHWITHDWY